MRLKTSLALLLIICLSSSVVFAQRGKKDGFIITPQNDTLFGKIEFRDLTQSRKECIFTGDNGTIVYTPSQIKGYGYTGDRFYTSQVLTDTFLQVLVSGELSLYKGGSEYYLEKKGNNLLKLEYELKKDTIDGKAYESQKMAWKGYVNILIFDCIKDQEVIKNLSLNERDLTRLTLDYNKCRGAQYTDYLAKKPWTKMELGVVAGLSHSSINIKNASATYDYLPSKYVSNDPVLGLVIVLSSPRFYDRLALQSEIEYLKSDFFCEKINTYPSHTDYNDSYISLTTLSFPQSLRYTLIDRNFKVYVNLGLVLTNYLKREARLESEVLSGSNVITNAGRLFEISDRPLDYWGGVGFSKPFNKFTAGVSFKYIWMNNFCTGGFGSDLTHLSLSLIISTK
jgi:hypothetical protein